MGNGFEKIPKVLAQGGDDLLVLGMKQFKSSPNAPHGAPGAKGHASPHAPHGKNPNPASAGDLDSMVKHAEELNESATPWLMGLGLGVPFAGGMIAKGGKWAGIGAAEKLGGSLSALGETTFKQVGEKTGTGRIFGAISDVFAGAASIGAKGLEATGISGVAAKFYGSRLAKSAEKMYLAADGVFAHGVNHPALAEIEAQLKGGLHAMDYEKVTKALEEVKTAAAQANHSGLVDSLGKFEKHLTNTEVQHGFASGWKNLPENAANLTSHMSGASVVHGAMNTSFIIGAGFSNYHTLTDLKKGLNSLKTMYSAATHTREEDVSVLSLLIGKVPPTVARARAELYKEFGPAVVLDAANTMLNINFAANSKYGHLTKSMIMLMAVPMLNQFVVRQYLGTRSLPAYDVAKGMEDQKQPVTPEAFGKLIGNASDELYKLGAEDSNFTKALAQIYANAHAKVDVVLQEINNGTLHKRIVMLQKEYGQHQAAQPHTAAAPEAKHEALAADGAGFVNRLQNGESAPQNRVVLGEHTEKLNRVSQAAEPHLFQAV